MITAVCMNPAFDKTAATERFIPGGLNRLADLRCDAGGKGVNVARTISRLGGTADCVGCLGAGDEAAFLALLAEEKILFHGVSVPGRIRTNLKVLDASTGCITELNEPGFVLTPKQQQDFLVLLREKTENSAYVIFSGSLPKGCSAAFYRECMRDLQGKKCVLDVDGEALTLGMKESPFLVKPNLPELEAIVQKKLGSVSEVREAACMLITRGAENVVVSLGKDGALFANGTQALFAPPLSVKVQSTVGAGDAMTGAMVMAIAQGERIIEAFRYGVAAGSAAVMTAGTQPLSREDFEWLLPQVRLEKL